MLFKFFFHFQALAHSSGYDSTDEEMEAGGDTADMISVRHGHGHDRSRLRGARSEEFLDRPHLEERRGPR